MASGFLPRVSALFRGRLAEYSDPIRRRLRPTYGQLRARYAKLEPRERLLVGIAAGLLGVFFFYNLIYLPFVNYREAIATEIADKQFELQTVHKQALDYARLKTRLSLAERRTVAGGKDFSLFSVLEGPLSREVGRERIVSITPSQRNVSGDLIQYTLALKLAGVNLDQIVDALYGMNTVDVPLTVTSLSVKKSTQNPHSFDVDLTCAALGKNA
ncbi:MAG TPA: type II secretion system protein GspM [Candidatus Binataceae bacterium]